MEAKYNIEKENNKFLQKRMNCLEEKNMIDDKLKLELSTVCTEQKEKIIDLWAAKGDNEAAKMKQELTIEQNRLSELQTKVEVMTANKAMVEA